MEKQLENPKFEVGKWHKRPHNKALLFATTDKGNGWYSGYGFDNGGVWMNLSSPQWRLEGEIPATDEEVEEALIKEAGRRGFKKGVRFKSAISNWECLSSKNDFKYIHKHDYYDGCLLFLDGNGVFCNGKWAEIIKDDFIDDLPKIKQESIINNDYNIF